MTIAISKIDHIALRASDLDAMLDFYQRLGATIERRYEIDGRTIMVQLHLGGAMLNIHAHHDHPLVASVPTPGSGDLCFRWNEAIATAVRYLEDAGIEIIEGPVARHASDGNAGMSVYFRDPDGNLLELLTTVEGAEV